MGVELWNVKESWRNLSLVLRRANISRICSETLNSYNQAAALHLQTNPHSPDEGSSEIHSPVRMFLQHLIDTDAEGFIIVAFMDEIFVYPKLSSSDRLALWDT